MTKNIILKPQPKFKIGDEVIFSDKHYSGYKYDCLDIRLPQIMVEDVSRDEGKWIYRLNGTDYRNCFYPEDSLLTRKEAKQVILDYLEKNFNDIND